MLDIIAAIYKDSLTSRSESEQKQDMEEFSRMVSEALELPEHRVQNTLKRLLDGATIPFVSRYRKEATGGMDEVQISEINTR